VPDYVDDDTAPRSTELCTIGSDTYVHWPDEIELLEQPIEISESVETVTLTPELMAEIKALSPHVQLSYERLQNRIRSKYSIEDEQAYTRFSIGALAGTYTMKPHEPAEIAEYQAWVEESREIARLERVALGLG